MYNHVKRIFCMSSFTCNQTIAVVSLCFCSVQDIFSCISNLAIKRKQKLKLHGPVPFSDIPLKILIFTSK